MSEFSNEKIINLIFINKERIEHLICNHLLITFSTLSLIFIGKITIFLNIFDFFI